MAVRILVGDCRERLRELPDESVHCVVTSPPYFGLRDYGVGGQIGLEASPDEFVAELVAVFREVRRVMKNDATLWLNLGDSYCSTDKWGGGGNVGKNTVAPDGSVPSWQVRNRRAPMEGLKPKDLIGIPWRVAFALQADGWWLRQDIIWSKPNPMPESVTDRCTKAHEYVFMLTKSARYHYDAEAIREAGVSDRPDMATKGIRTGLAYLQQGSVASNSVKPDKQRGHSRRHAGFNDRWDAMERADQTSGMRNKRSVWTVATQPFSEAHFATFPPDLIEPCIKAGCPVGGTVLDPFGGAGTTGLVADRLQRNAILIELNPNYADMAERRIWSDQPMLSDVRLETAGVTGRE